MSRFNTRGRGRPYRPRHGGKRRPHSLWKERGPIKVFNRSRHGIIWGVCRGAADHFNLSVGWVRFFTVAITLLTGVWPGLIVYILAALLMKPEPVPTFRPAAGQESAAAMEHENRNYEDHSHLQERLRSLQELKERFAGLDQRLRSMEDDIVSRDYEWERRFNE